MKKIVRNNKGDMEEPQVVDSKLQLIEYKVNSKLINTPRQQLEQHLESENIKRLIKHAKQLQYRG